MGQLLASAGVWYWLILPQQHIAVLSDRRVNAALAGRAHVKLHRIPGYAQKADELLADFWRRQALSAEAGEDRDSALLYRVRSLNVRDSDFSRRELAALVHPDYDSLRRIFRHGQFDADVILNRAGDRLLTWSRDFVRIWDVATGRQIGPDIRPPVTKLDAAENSQARKSDGKAPTTSGEQRTEKFIAVAFSPDGSMALTGSSDGTARLWSTSDGKPIGEPLRYEGMVTAVAFSPDGSMVLTGSSDGTARLWSTPDGKPIGEPLRHEGVVRAVAFSPDGSMVLTGSSDGTARPWSTPDGKPTGEPLRHEDAVRAVAFSSDGSMALTGSYDFTARLWSTRDGKPTGEPLRHEGVVRDAGSHTQFRATFSR